MDETSTSLYRVTKSFVLFQSAYLGQQTALKRWRVQGIKNTFVTLHRKPGGQYFYCCQQEFPLVVCSFCSSGPTGCPPLYCTVQISVNDMDFWPTNCLISQNIPYVKCTYLSGLNWKRGFILFLATTKVSEKGLCFLFMRRKNIHVFCSGLMNFSKWNGRLSL